MLRQLGLDGEPELPDVGLIIPQFADQVLATAPEFFKLAGDTKEVSLLRRQMDEPTRLSVERIVRIDKPCRLHCRLKTGASDRECRRQESKIGAGQREDPFKVSNCKIKQILRFKLGFVFAERWKRFATCH